MKGDRYHHDWQAAHVTWHEEDENGADTYLPRTFPLFIDSLGVTLPSFRHNTAWRDQWIANQMDFVSVYSPSVCSDLSRPLPDCFTPPKGIVISGPAQLLM